MVKFHLFLLDLSLLKLPRSVYFCFCRCCTCAFLDFSVSFFFFQAEIAQRLGWDGGNQPAGGSAGETMMFMDGDLVDFRSKQ